MFSLVTVNDTDPTPYVGGNGSGNFTMRYKVNGANVSPFFLCLRENYIDKRKVYSRGGNMIPLEEFEGRANEDAFSYLLQSVVDGGLNTLRIWGGGISFSIIYLICLHHLSLSLTLKTFSCTISFMIPATSWEY